MVCTESTNGIRLQSKGVQFPSICVLCGEQLENIWHIFLTCSKVIPCWIRIHLWDDRAFAN